MSKREAITAVAAKYGFGLETPWKTILEKAGEEYPEKGFTHSDVGNWKTQLKRKRLPSVVEQVEQEGRYDIEQIEHYLGDTLTVEDLARAYVYLKAILSYRKGPRDLTELYREADGVVGRIYEAIEEFDEEEEDYE